MKTRLMQLLALTLILPAFTAPANAESLANPSKNQQILTNTRIPYPFFMMGDGKIKIKNIHNGRTADLMMIDKDGKLIDDAFYKIDKVFGFPTAQKGEHISLRTLFMLDHFSDHFAPGETILMNSGYRSPKYNQGLRDKGRTAAKTSTHMDGMALDFSIKGVGGKDMWEYIRHKDCCGTGHYGGANIHLDSGRPRFWETATSKVKTKASAFNRYMYLSTEYDKYKAEDEVRLFYTSISDFGFGVKASIQFVKDAEGQDKVSKAKLNYDTKKKCHMINQRKDARFLSLTIPKKLKAGRYRVRIDFCEKPFEEMPDFRVSNEIEILKQKKK